MDISIIPKNEFDRVNNNSHIKHNILSLFSYMCRYNTFVSIKLAGSGHLGSSFSAMDLVVYLYLKELNTRNVGFNSPNRDIYFSSKGHDVPGLYSVLYALGIIPEEKLLKLRKLNGLDGHPNIITNGIESNTGSLGMGISKGKGFAWAKKYLNYNGRVFVLTGDGEFQEGQIYESLQATANQKVNNLTVIIDKNKYQTDMLVQQVNSIDNLESKVKEFGWYVACCSGHNFDDIERAFSEVKEITDKPKFIIADTIKGKGISFLEEPYSTNGISYYKWHSGAPDDDYFEKGIEELKRKIILLAKNSNISEIKYKHIQEYVKVNTLLNKTYLTDAYGDALCDIAKDRKDIVVLDGDLAADCRVRKFQNLYPDRFLENGIAEQDMVSTAGGLARQGLLPVVNSFASFLCSRANEQIYNNACEHSKIIYVCHFAGFIPAGPGKSHQSVRDISLINGIPNMIIAQPANQLETKNLLEYFVYKATENCALRINIGPSPSNIEFDQSYKLKFGQGTVLKDGTDSVCFGYGPVMLHEILEAASILHNLGFSLKVIDMPWLNRVDKDWFINEISGFENIYVIEDHNITGALGDLLIYEANSSGILKRFHKIGIEGYPAFGTPQEVLRYHKLDGKSIAERIFGNHININSMTENYTVEAPQ